MLTGIPVAPSLTVGFLHASQWSCFCMPFTVGFCPALVISSAHKSCSVAVNCI